MGNYPSFESRPGEVIEIVEANCRWLTHNGSFDEQSHVPVSDVELFAKQGYFFVIGKLLRGGYGTAPANDDVREILTTIQALHATVQTEAASPTDDKGEPNYRYKGFAVQRDEIVESFLTGGGLVALGQSRASTGPMSDLVQLTGRSKARKDDVYANTDLVQPRFKRGYLGSSTSSESTTE